MIRRLALAGIFAAIFFGQGLFVGGILPVVHDLLPTHASLTYALYYAGLVLGQLVVAFVPKASAKRHQYPLYEASFGASILFIGAAFAFAPWNVIVGRFVEGLAAGLALPLAFAYAARVETLGDMRRRVAFFNSCFAIGFVAGPALVTQLLRVTEAATLLVSFGAGFAALALSLLPFLRRLPAPSEWSEPESTHTPRASWLDTSFTLFLAKSFYGYLLASVAAGLIDRLHPLTLPTAMVAFSIVFVVGQGIATALESRLPAQHLRAYLPLLLFVAIALCWRGRAMPFVFVAALAHSMLVHLAYTEAGAEPAGARAFARANVASDPGMLIGASLAGFGWSGSAAILALCLVPLARALVSAPASFRPERFFPLVGPVHLVQMLRKYDAPLVTPRDLPAEAVRELAFEFSAPHETRPILRLAFCGDLGPVRSDVRPSPALEELFARHDLRLANLEGPLTRTHRSTLAVHGIATSQLDAMRFDALAISNNHALDRGAPMLDRTLEELARRDVVAIGSELRIIERHGIRIGLFARTYGSNLFFRAHPQVVTLKPETLATPGPERDRLLAEIAAHRAKCDLLVMSWHWGYEAEVWPSEVQRECWRVLRDAGVDVLWGHHSHVVQPFETDGRRVCLYSTGNFALEMPQRLFSQGAVSSIAIARDDGGWKIIDVKTHFLERRSDVLELLDAHDAEAFRHFHRTRDAA